MKQKIGNVFLVLFIVGLLIYLLLSATLDLTNKEDLHTVQIDGAFEVLELEHSINGLIPIGTDYYYIGIEEESCHAYIIKAPKKWLEENFDSDYVALAPNGLQITALAKEVSDYRTSRELASRAALIEEAIYPLGTEYCLDLGYQTTAIKKLILFAVSVFLIITGFYFVKNKGNVNKIFVECWIVLLIIWLVLLLGVIR